MAVEFIAQTIPAQIFRSGAGLTLFHVAMLKAPNNDALQWVAIAELNGLTDPWINGQVDVLIPPVFPTGTQTGILEPA